MEHDETRPYLVDGWIMLPDTADHYPTMVLADDVHYVCVESREGYDLDETCLVLTKYHDGEEHTLVTDEEFYDEVCALVREARTAAASAHSGLNAARQD